MWSYNRERTGRWYGRQPQDSKSLWIWASIGLLLALVILLMVLSRGQSESAIIMMSMHASTLRDGVPLFM